MSLWSTVDRTSIVCTPRSLVCANKPNRANRLCPHTHTRAQRTDLLSSSFAADPAALQAAVEHLVGADQVMRVGSTLQLKDRCVICKGG